MADLESVLRTVVDEIACERGFKEYDVVIKPIDSGGANYTTELFQVTLTPKQKKSIKLFAKVAAASESMRKQLDMDLYEKERFFYEELNPKLDRTQDSHDISNEDRLATPGFYGYKDKDGTEVLILEDLTAKAFVNFDRTRGISWEFAARSVEQLARFHALSFALQHENPDEYKTFKSKCTMNFANIAMLLRKMMQNNVLLVKDELKKRLTALIENHDLVQEWIDYGKPTEYSVLTHGDYKGSNIMYRRNNGVMETVPMDFQTMAEGCPVYDLFYFIYTGSDEEFRRLHYQQLVEHYYKELSNMLQRLHLDVDQVYPREAFEDDQTRLKRAGLILGLTLLSGIYVDSDDAPEKGEEVSESTFKPSKLYVEILNGIVSDYVVSGVL